MVQAISEVTTEADRGVALHGGLEPPDAVNASPSPGKPLMLKHFTKGSPCVTAAQISSQAAHYESYRIRQNAFMAFNVSRL